MAPLHRLSRHVARATAVLFPLVAMASQGPAFGMVSAAPVAFEASFRDLPGSVRAGDVLTVQVDTQASATCDGTITYRGGATQTLAKVAERDRRCRWDVTVPEATRRGTADVAVRLVREGEDETTIAAGVEVTSRGDEVDAKLRALPGTARRGEEVSIRLDVADGATCQGAISYDDGRSQALAPQPENRERCRWDVAVAPDAAYGPAKVVLVVTQGSGQATLAGSFEVGRRSDDAPLVVGIKDLAPTVRREGAFVIRAMVPNQATCSGSVTYRSASQSLEDRKESDGECVWIAQVPADARGGAAEVALKVQRENDATTTLAGFMVGGGASDLDASFRSLPGSVRRGETFEIRVTVPNGASCNATIAYSDDTPRPLGAQAERRERCVWEVKVPSNAPRGTATVRVTVSDGADSTALVSSVEILSKDGD